MEENIVIKELLKQNNKLKLLLKEQTINVKKLNQINNQLNHSNQLLTKDKLNLMKIIKDLKKK